MSQVLGRVNSLAARIETGVPVKGQDVKKNKRKVGASRTRRKVIVEVGKTVRKAALKRPDENRSGGGGLRPKTSWVNKEMQRHKAMHGKVGRGIYLARRKAKCAKWEKL